MNWSRRHFLSATTAAAASAAAWAPRAFGQDASSTPRPTTEVARARPRQDLDLVYQFVGAGHANLPKVKEMLAADPKLVLALHDWGGGDWESALGGAAHVGNREIALHLLEHGARIDSFSAAMLGERAVIAALVAASPTVATTKGPHGFTLLYHAAISGDAAIAALLKPHLPAERDADYNQALHAAARGGHAEMTEWLLQNGVTDPNTRDAFKKTPLATAAAKGFSPVVEILRRGGAAE